MSPPGNSSMGDPQTDWLKAVAHREAILILCNKPRNWFALGLAAGLKAIGSKFAFIAVTTNVIQFIGFGKV